ncbi:hypothetical protein PVAND_010361 [Polypedilum vanderplanki]|uniref:Zinc finger protein n=1 Tax=Polypedilum vanderplanki TaxID=319348 RepID=A0A9J6CFF7_POLVA|nr:hypothetical protein PVAND_010361 [Polypedilum vanderplanki]
MAQCIVKSCKSKNRELFCAPDDKNKLRKWKQILGTAESNFLICEVHFDQKYIGREKFLQQDAYPSILIEENEYTSEEFCQCCLKTFEANDSRMNVSEKLQKIFINYTSFEIEINSFLCIECHDKLLDVDNFLKSVMIKHEIKMNQLAIKSEPVVEIDEDYGEVQSSSELQDDVTDQRYSRSPSRRPTLVPKKIETLMHQSSYEKNKRPDSSSNDSQQSEAKRPRLNRSEASHDHGFLTNLNLQCNKCYQTFPTNLTLKLHHESDHVNDKVKITQRKSAGKFGCVPQCGITFDTYHFLQKHREECQYCPRLKCNQPYCRARFGTVEELIEHQKGHDSLRCRECKLQFSSFEELNEHQITDHKRLMEGVSRRSRGRPRKLRPEDQIYDEMGNFDDLQLEQSEESHDTENSKVKCLKCEMMIFPADLNVHMKEYHYNKRNS